MTKVTTESPLGDALARGREAGVKLNAATDRLNELLQSAEAAIVDLGLGVEGSVMIGSFLQKGTIVAERLSYRKEGKEWHLFIEDDSHPDDWNAVRLVNASRERRVRSAGFLPALVKELVSLAEREAERINSQNRALEGLIEDLGGFL
ncbi:MAG: hypothetical protein JST92_16795 [Deltaproteobacteria bacterium]|nr:hypothetical protein [Deltaproteobacteria bacterium]